MMELAKYQKEGVDFLTSRRFAYLADEMGLGKTAQAIGALNKVKPKNAIILAPAMVIATWEAQLKIWNQTGLPVTRIRSGDDELPIQDQILLCSYSLFIRKPVRKKLRELFKEHPLVCFIADEAHALKERSSKTSKYVVGQWSLFRGCKYGWLLSGTPLLNRPIELWPVLHALASKLIHPYEGWNDFAIRYCGGYWDCGLQAKGATNIEELKKRIKPFMLRRTFEDVNYDLPEYIEIPLVIDIDSVNTAEYMATNRRLDGTDKSKLLKPYLVDIIEKHDKVVIFAHHRDVIEHLQTALAEYNPVTVYGGMSPKSKENSIARFINDDTVKIVIGQITAMSSGVDGLQTVSNCVVHTEYDWTPGIIDQANARCRRRGQNKPTYVYYLSGSNTIDVLMKKVLDKKRKVITSVLLTNGEQKPMSMEARITELTEAVLKLTSALENKIVVTTGSNNTTELPVKQETAKKSTKKAEKETPLETLPDDNLDAEEMVKDIVEGPKPAVSEFTQDDVIKAASAVVKQFTDIKQGRARIQGLLKNNYSVEKIAELKPEKYATFMALLKAVKPEVNTPQTDELGL